MWEQAGKLHRLTSTSHQSCFWKTATFHKHLTHTQLVSVLMVESWAAVLSVKQSRCVALHQSHCNKHIVTVGCVLQESTALDVYGEWVPVDKTTSKTTADTNFTSPSIPASSDTVASTGQCDAAQQPAVVAEADCVFNDQILQVSPKKLYGQFSCFRTRKDIYLDISFIELLLHFQAFKAYSQ